ncbi:hypothetical protein WA026_020111 [Henosepilachna vigintioctopunctata]|uniref:Uncharacterized protein n=1 Tax=Henosepilachna vigintioctopunctata TaxID=420089 RepID=A0AAW1U5T7_9CUCU
MATIVQGYGQTENTGLLTGFNIGDPEEKNLTGKHPDSCGRVMPTFEMKVVDIDNEKILPKGGRGELRVKNKYMMNGYYKMDSSSAFDSDGWFKTGDVVYFDEDDCLHIVDRVKDIIDYALHWIHPSTIEQIVYQHPAVFENFVFGYPHPTDTERTYAVVVLKDEFKNKVTEDELIAFVNERVPNDWYKIRAGLTFLDKMLKTPTGKLRRLAMKQAIIDKKV